MFSIQHICLNWWEEGNSALGCSMSDCKVMSTLESLAGVNNVKQVWDKTGLNCVYGIWAGSVP